jgi:hypothetical protein
MFLGRITLHDETPGENSIAPQRQANARYVFSPLALELSRKRMQPSVALENAPESRFQRAKHVPCSTRSPNFGILGNKLGAATGMPAPATSTTSALSNLRMGVGRSGSCQRSLDARISGEIHYSQIKS